MLGLVQDRPIFSSSNALSPIESGEFGKSAVFSSQKSDRVFFLSRLLVPSFIRLRLWFSLSVQRIQCIGLDLLIRFVD